MFSGIVVGQGIIERIRPHRSGYQLTIQPGRARFPVKKGDSVSVDGCCLTLVKSSGKTWYFDVLQETWKRTSLGCAKAGQKVNLEPALRVGDLLGGHFVTGHVDECGRIAVKKMDDGDVYLEIEAGPSLMRHMAFKGSVAVDGVSLTVSRVKTNRFGVCVIPHTLKATTLGWKKKGERVNLEADILARYVLRCVNAS